MARKLARVSSVPHVVEPEPEEPEPPEEEDELEGLSPDGWRPTPLLYDVGDTCFILGKISKQMLYRLIHLKKIHPVKMGSRSMFTMQELERFVSERAAETEAEDAAS